MSIGIVEICRAHPLLVSRMEFRRVAHMNTPCAKRAYERAQASIWPPEEQVDLTLWLVFLDARQDHFTQVCRKAGKEEIFGKLFSLLYTMSNSKPLPDAMAVVKALWSSSLPSKSTASGP